MTNIPRPEWDHPYLHTRQELSRQQLEAFAYHYFLKFLMFFRDQPEGSIRPGLEIKYSAKMKHKLGLADLFNHNIRLNYNYFRKDPALLPYTLFHEMIHIWLYNCDLDPGHTRRFYFKMKFFEATKLPIDQKVHIHKRVASEAKFVFTCPNCKNKWFTNSPKEDKRLYCGFCYEQSKEKYYPVKFTNHNRHSLGNL